MIASREDATYIAHADVCMIHAHKKRDGDHGAHAFYVVRASLRDTTGTVGKEFASALTTTGLIH